MRDPNPTDAEAQVAEDTRALADEIQEGERLLRLMGDDGGHIRAAAERIMATGSGASADAETVAAAWLADHPAADSGPCPEIEDTPGACNPDT